MQVVSDTSQKMCVIVLSTDYRTYIQTYITTYASEVEADIVRFGEIVHEKTQTHNDNTAAPAHYNEILSTLSGVLSVDTLAFN